jgi:hypothetical protein
MAAVRWEYHVTLLTEYPDLEARLAALGDVGYELVAIVEGRAYLKRPKRDRST